jgi:hypothetical protein
MDDTKRTVDPKWLKYQVGTPASPDGGTPMGATRTVDPKWLKYKQGNEETFDFPDPEIGAKEAGLPVLSGYRTEEEQKTLYEASQQPGYKGNPVAEPGKSRHNVGEALDIDMAKATPEHIKWLEKEGYHRPLPDTDPNHWELVTPRKRGSSFDLAYKQLAEIEGGYNNDPNDLGGETNFGISSKANPDVDVKTLTPDTAKKIIKERYWDAIDADKIPSDMRMQVFDTAVNMGVDTAKKLYNESEGDSTKFLQLRKQEYDEIVKNNPSQKDKYEQWITRADKVANVSLRGRVIQEEEKDPKEISDWKIDDWTKSEIDKGAVDANLSSDAYTERIVRNYYGSKENAKRLVNDLNTKYKSQYDEKVTKGNTELDQLTTDYKSKIEKLQTEFDRKKKATVTPEEHNKLVDDFNAKVEKESTAYQSTFDKKRAALEDDVKKLDEQKQKEAGDFSLNFKKNVDQENKKGQLLDDTDRADIQKALEKAPNRYEDKVKFIGDLVDFYLYDYTGDEAKKLREEIYDTINEKLLIDDKGNPTAFNLKNQAKLGIRRIANDYNQLKAEYTKARKIAEEKNKNLLGKSFGYSGAMGGSTYEMAINSDPLVSSLQNKLINLEQSIKNYTNILNLPEPKTKGGREGSFIEGMDLPVSIINAFVLGTLELKDKIKKAQIEDRNVRGLPISNDEQQLLDSSLLVDVTAGQLRPGFSAWYEAGVGGGKSLEFMAELASTGGIYKLAKIGTMKALGWQLGKRGLVNTMKRGAGELAGAIARTPFQSSFQGFNW